MRSLYFGMIVVLAALVAVGCGGPNKGSLAESMKKQKQAEKKAEKEAPQKETAKDETAKDETTAGDVAKGKSLFSSSCASCHTLSDAAATGAAGTNLDELKPSLEIVLAQIKSGGGGMPPALLSGQDATDVATYVSEAAGK